MERLFTLEQARAALPEARRRIAEAAALRRTVVEIDLARQAGRESPLGGLAEAKAAEAKLFEILGWFQQEGIQVKGLSPALIDFPARTADGITLLCWLEGEDDLTHHHDPQLGFAGREPIDTIVWPDD